MGILRNQKLTPVPHTPSHVAGVVNLRGELIPVLSLHRILLQGHGPAAGDDPKLVVVQAHGRTAGLLVDQVLDVLSVPAGALTPVSGGIAAEESIVLAAFRTGQDAEDVVVLVRLAPLVEAQGDFSSEEIRQP
jgi:purine-binding chemotaxis protein CheW